MFISNGLYLKEIYQLFDQSAVSDFLPAHGREIKTRERKGITAVEMTGHEHIGENGHPREKLNILKRSADAYLDEIVCVHTGDIAVVKDNTTAFRLVKPGDAIHETRFAGPVRADDGEKFPVANLEINIGKGLHPAKI
jgi:hypothetical protein